jgi:hypothetical protein
MVKVCCKCKQEKDISCFVKSKSRKDGYHPQCKECSRNYNQSRKDLRNARSRKWKEGHKDQVNAYARKWYADNPEKAADIRYRTRYGMTKIEREAFIKSRGSKCECCGTKEEDLPRGLCLHHNHTTDSVEFVLCHNCNGAYGLLNDSPDLVMNLQRLVSNIT